MRMEQVLESLNLSTPFLSLSTSSLPLSSSNIADNTRARIWKYARNVIEDKNIPIRPRELLLLDKLLNKVDNTSGPGLAWMRMLPMEWVEIYGALYEEAQFFNTSERETEKIDKDVNRTFSLFASHPFFSSGVAKHIGIVRDKRMGSEVEEGSVDHIRSLRSVLTATSHEMHYCQGVNFIAAAILLNAYYNPPNLSSDNPQSPAACSFILLCYLLKQCHLEILFNAHCSSLLEYMKYFEKKLRRHDYEVYKHLRDCGFGSICYAIEWFTTCFVVTAPGLLSECVMDLLFICHWGEGERAKGSPDEDTGSFSEGNLHRFDNVMIRVGLALMSHLRTQILACKGEELQLKFKRMVKNVGKKGEYELAELLATALSIDINGGVCILKTMVSNIEKMEPNHEFINTLRDPLIPTDADDDNNINMPPYDATRSVITSQSIHDIPPFNSLTCKTSTSTSLSQMQLRSPYSAVAKDVDSFREATHVKDRGENYTIYKEYEGDIDSDCGSAKALSTLGNSALRAINGSPDLPIVLSRSLRRNNINRSFQQYVNDSSVTRKNGDYRKWKKERRKMLETNLKNQLTTFEDVACEKKNWSWPLFTPAHELELQRNESPVYERAVYSHAFNFPNKSNSPSRLSPCIQPHTHQSSSTIRNHADNTSFAPLSIVKLFSDPFVQTRGGECQSQNNTNSPSTFPNALLGEENVPISTESTISMINISTSEAKSRESAQSISSPTYDRLVTLGIIGSPPLLRPSPAYPAYPLSFPSPLSPQGPLDSPAQRDSNRLSLIPPTSPYHKLALSTTLSSNFILPPLRSEISQTTSDKLSGDVQDGLRGKDNKVIPLRAWQSEGMLMKNHHLKSCLLAESWTDCEKESIWKCDEEPKEMERRSWYNRDGKWQISDQGIGCLGSAMVSGLFGAFKFEGITRGMSSIQTSHINDNLLMNQDKVTRKKRKSKKSDKKMQCEYHMKECISKSGGNDCKNIALMKRKGKLSKVEKCKQRNQVCEQAMELVMSSSDPGMEINGTIQDEGHGGNMECLNIESRGFMYISEDVEKRGDGEIEDEEYEQIWQSTGMPSSAGSSPSSPTPFIPCVFPPEDSIANSFPLNAAPSLTLRSSYSSPPSPLISKTRSRPESLFSRAFCSSTDTQTYISSGAFSEPQLSSPLFPLLPPFHVLQHAQRYKLDNGLVRRRDPLIRSKSNAR